MKNFFSLSNFQANWKSGLTVSLIAIPMSCSLAVASGVTPIMAIITAIWAGLVGATFGSSNYNIIGVTGALSGVVASFALLHGIAAVPALAVMAGLFILLAYLFRLHRYLVFVPASVIQGFTLGVAAIISLNQLNFMLGLRNLPKHLHFIDNVIESFKHLGDASVTTGLTFIIFFAALFILSKVIKTIPGSIIISPFGIALGYATSKGLLPFTLETLGSRFGEIQLTLVQWQNFVFGGYLVMPALVVAFVAIIETMLSAKIADAVTKTKHNPRKEMLGLGLANVAAGLVGGIPATAALARTAFNIKNGATSKLSAMLSALFIVLTSLVFLSYFSYIPMVVVAAILVYASVNMVERQHFVRMYAHDKVNFMIAILVAVITVYEDPIIGVLVGSVMSLLLLVNKLAQSFYEIAVHESAVVEHEAAVKRKNIIVYTFKGKLVYINSQSHLIQFEHEFTEYAAIVLNLQDLYFIDLDGVDTLDEIIELLQNRGQKVMLVPPAVTIRQLLKSSRKYQELMHDGLVIDSVQVALHKFGVE